MFRLGQPVNHLLFQESFMRKNPVQNLLFMIIHLTSKVLENVRKICKVCLEENLLLFGEKCDFLLCKSFVDIYTSCLLASCLVSVIYECLPLLWMVKCIICIKKGPSCYFYYYCIKREANKMKISSHTRPVLSMALMHAHTH